ncbi:glycosyltransferase [Kushneria indalinina]|uniref:Glycosyl transferase family 2 n=1 Tax=Kushneria indalinina DSM 14324 TaxID=1122140 RepID=A0A3D9DU83_9GAMM|nr:glycosyltransferase family A protein [Kushneria indalinina]REC94323.1 glycosyl transferase family 2 [Kushneria indalinina DSM 14324]
MHRYINRKLFKLSAFYLKCYFFILNRFNSKSLESKNQEIVVSLTTHTARINDVYLTLESLFHQTTDGYSVYLYISQEDRKKIGHLPQTLKRLQSRGLNIIFIENDYRSYNKLIHALEQHREKLIVTADDDTMYPQNWLDRLIEGHQKHPNCIICHRGHIWSESTPGAQEINYNLIKNKNSHIANQPSYKLMPTGNSGVLYPPGSLDDIVFNAKLFTELAPTADDIWFKICSLKKGTPCIRINNKNMEFAPTEASAKSALHEENIKKNGNDRQLKACLEHFPEVKKLLFD